MIFYAGKRTQKYDKDDKETVCSYYVTYAFYSESALSSCLNVKEILARNRHDIWNLIECNGIRMHNHKVCKRTLNHLVKLVNWLNG